MKQPAELLEQQYNFETLKFCNGCFAAGTFLQQSVWENHFFSEHFCKLKKY